MNSHFLNNQIKESIPIMFSVSGEMEANFWSSTLLVWLIVSLKTLLEPSFIWVVWLSVEASNDRNDGFEMNKTPVIVNTIAIKWMIPNFSFKNILAIIAVNMMLVFPNAAASEGNRMSMPLYKHITANTWKIDLLKSKTRCPLAPKRFSFL